MEKIKYQIIKRICCFCFVLMLVSSCKKYLNIDPPDTSASAQSVYTNDAQAAGVLTAVYGKMSGNGATGFATGRGSVTLYTGLTSDELETYAASGASFVDYYTYNVSMMPDLAAIWTDIYSQIYLCNAAIEGISRSTGVSANMKKQLIGEARFARAFLHFYLVNLYGDVPLITTTDYKANSLVSRTPRATVYQQIIDDLTEARNLLTDAYRLPNGNTTADRLRPNKAAATAMLARVNLYLGEWAKAEALASELIDNVNYSLTPLANIYSTTSREAIWQLAVVVTQQNTYDGNTFIRTVPPNGSEPVSLTSRMVNAFVAGDQRKTNWIDSITVATVKYYYPKKYKVKGGTPATTVISEHLTPLRLAEQYLIRAEARTKQGKLTGANSAQSDINVIRTRAGLSNTTATTEADLLLAIEQERRIELFCEFGHRWFDLKRTGRLDAVMSAFAPLKGTTWNSNVQLYPLPRAEMDKNPNLRPQNPGYN